MSKNNSQDKDEKPSKKHKKASPSKKGKSKQEMNHDLAACLRTFC